MSQNAVNYLILISNEMISNKIFIFIVFFIEICPLFYSSAFFAFKISNNSSPSDIFNRLSYISYYAKAAIEFKNSTHTIIFYGSTIFILSYFFFKYLSFYFFYKKENKIFVKVFLNFYEIFIFRLAAIFLLNSSIYITINGNQVEIFFGITYFIIQFIWLFYHFHIHYIHISLQSVSSFSFNNKILSIIDIYFLFIKTIICFKDNLPQKVPRNRLDLLLDYSMMIFNIISLLHILYLTIIYKFTYVSNNCCVFLRIWYVIFINIFQFYIFFTKTFTDTLFFLAVVNVAIISISFTILLQKLSISKVQNYKNEIGNVIWLLNKSNSKDIKVSISLIMYNHLSNCGIDKCYLCNKLLSENRKESLTAVQLCNYLIKYVKRKKVNANSFEIIDQIGIQLLLELLIMQLSGKSLIKILIKYNKIRALLNQQKNKRYKRKQRFNYNSSKLFVINLHFLIHQIKAKVSSSHVKTKFEYLITMENIISHLNVFMLEIGSFFKRNLKNMREIITLATKFSKIKNDIDITFLQKKENRFNYSCVLVCYLMEELFNKKISKAINYAEFVHSIDDVLNYHFKENKFILMLCNIITHSFTIKLCGKELINYKGKEFEYIFPRLLRQEGKSKFIKLLEGKTDHHFEFYFDNQEKETIEIFKMNFYGVPSMDQNCSLINLICTFDIIKESLLLFQNKIINYKPKKVLMMVSEKLSTQFKFVAHELNKSIRNLNYIYIDEVFTENLIINHLYLHKFLGGKSKEKGNTFILKKYFYELKENINENEIYQVKEKIKRTKLEKTTLLQTAIDTEILIEDEEITEEKKIDKIFTVTNTYLSSNTLSQSSYSGGGRADGSQKEIISVEYKNFMKFTYYLISLISLIIIIIIIFLVVELINNNEIKTIYRIITNYYDFQNYFYMTSLSIFSLTCTVISLDDEECKNSFADYSYDFIYEHNLSENQLITDYVSRELTFKADYVMTSLKDWELENNYIDSEDKAVVLSKKFDYTILEQNGIYITVNTVYLTFEEAVKRFTTNINLITASEDFLSSPTYTISSDGKEYVNLENFPKNKGKEGSILLSETQKLYYTMVINFQKYILRLISIGDIIYTYFQDKIKQTNKILLLFIAIFIILNLITMIMSLVFIIQFKKMHIKFFLSIHKQITDIIFIKYYQKKLEQLSILLELYREPPMVIIEKINQIKKLEHSRKQKENKNQSKPKLIYVTGPIPKDKQNHEEQSHEINKNTLNNTYKKIYLSPFFLKIFILFGFYVFLCILFLLFIKKRIKNLSLMGKYTKFNYDLSNNIYIGTVLIRIMALTNQTDQDLLLYFSENMSSTLTQNGYVRSLIETAFVTVLDIKKIENEYSYFQPISTIININCSSLYKDLKDSFIELMVKQYPESNYYTLFETYCKSFQPLDVYSDPELAIMYVAYQMSQLLDMFVNREYDTYAYINNSNLISEIYSAILLLIRPIRKFVYYHISENIIENIIAKFIVSIGIFLFFNFFYETLILIFVKFHIVNKIIKSSKEIMHLAQAFECL